MMRIRILSILLLLITTGFAVARGASEDGDSPTAPTTSEESIPEEENRIRVDENTVALLERMGMLAFSHEVSVEEFTRPGLTATSMSLSDFEGSVVLVNFWATWCAPCREEMPTMQTLYDALDGSAFDMIAINVMETPEVAGAFIDEFGFTYPVMLDRDGEIAREFGVRGFPSTFVMSADGAIIAVRAGFHDWGEPEVVAATRELVASQTE